MKVSSILILSLAAFTTACMGGPSREQTAAMENASQIIEAPPSTAQCQQAEVLAARLDQFGDDPGTASARATVNRMRARCNAPANENRQTASSAGTPRK